MREKDSPYKFDLAEIVFDLTIGAIMILFVLWLFGEWAIGVIKMLADTWNAAFP